MTKHLVITVASLAFLTSCRGSATQEDRPGSNERAAAPRAAAPGEQTPPAQAPAKQEAVKSKDADPRAEPSKLEKQFADKLSGATLVGHFTMGDDPGQPKEERYVINKVTKLKGDYWLFTARIQYGQKDLTVPMMLPVKWAGDTAVISVTDLGIPGMGTYTARVLIHGDHYAGTWSGGKHGGHLWGRIERGMDDGPAGKSGAEEATEPPAEPKPQTPAEPQGEEPQGEEPQGEEP